VNFVNYMELYACSVIQNHQPARLIFKMAWNSKLALHQVFSAPDIQLTVWHADQISTAQCLFHQLIITVCWTHVKGHQDTGLPTMALSQDVILNIEADALAKQVLSKAIDGLISYYIPHSQWVCYLDED